MPKLTVLPHAEICPEGKIIEDVPAGESICRVLLDHHIEIEHACELSCACTTCHVIVRDGFESLEEASDAEEDLLDRAWGLAPNSRLSCQAKIEKHDLTIEIPRYTINHARENH
jgi:2Fe-2S ferredoxin